MSKGSKVGNNHKDTAVWELSVMGAVEVDQ